MRRHCSICGRTAGLKPFKQGYICAHCQQEVREFAWPVAKESEESYRPNSDADMTPFCRDPRQSF